MAIQNDTPKLGSGANGEAPPPQHRKLALISGIDGQLGSYLTEFLLGKGYEVYRFSHSHLNMQRVDHIYIDPRNNAVKASMKFRCSLLTDSSVSLRRWIDVISPDEVSSVAESAVGRGRGKSRGSEEEEEDDEGGDGDGGEGESMLKHYWSCLVSMYLVSVFGRGFTRTQTISKQYPINFIVT